MATGRILTEEEADEIIEVCRLMHTSCDRSKKKESVDTFPENDKLHNSPEEYLTHLKYRDGWLAVLGSVLKGVVNPRLPLNTGG